jgi:2-polyprenyl-6-hydroxyphenyl methylase/3-demethylubiquinone-9 3-methyltransferase
MSHHVQEVASGQRFAFGDNWRRFAQRLGPEQIAEAECDLRRMLGDDSLKGLTFLDIGSGSGLSSLAARRLGARVTSFDYDPQSVACTRALRERYCANDAQWIVAEGSVLDPRYLESLGTFDIVYAWGVLHHTGALWQALENAARSVADGGRLFVAIYNYQPLWTPVHTALKRAYVRAPRPLAVLLAGALVAFYAGRGLIKDLALLRNPLRRYTDYKSSRGMSWWHDCLDWIGGYPFETATPESVCHFLLERGFMLQRMATCGGGMGCNQFVLRRRGQ